MHKGTFVFSRPTSKRYCELVLAGHSCLALDLLIKEIQQNLPKSAARVSSYPLWDTIRWAGLSGRLCAQYDTVV